MAVPQILFSLLSVNCHDILGKIVELVFRDLRHYFEFIVVLFRMQLPPKARNPSLLCYLTHSQWSCREDRINGIIPFPSALVAKVNLTASTEFKSNYPFLWAIKSILQHLSHRRSIARFSLLYRYYYRRCSDESHSFVYYFRPSQLGPTMPC